MHGGGYLASYAGRIDHAWGARSDSHGNLPHPPTTYLKRIYYDSVVFQQESLELAIKVGGEDRVLYGSDYPHNIGDMEGCLARVDALPAAQAKRVRGAAARELFKL